MASIYLSEPGGRSAGILLGPMATIEANADYVLAAAAQMLKSDPDKMLELLRDELDALKNEESALQDRLAQQGEGSTEVVQDIAVTAAAISDSTARLVPLLQCVGQGD